MSRSRFAQCVYFPDSISQSINKQLFIRKLKSNVTDVVMTSHASATFERFEVL